jgi:hypothetical protein
LPAKRTSLALWSAAGWLRCRRPRAFPLPRRSGERWSAKRTGVGVVLNCRVAEAYEPVHSYHSCGGSAWLHCLPPLRRRFAAPPLPPPEGEEGRQGRRPRVFLSPSGGRTVTHVSGLKCYPSIGWTRQARSRRFLLPLRSRCGERPYPLSRPLLYPEPVLDGPRRNYPQDLCPDPP